MAENPQDHGALVEDDDPEWEYEYHETETESFYVTLDLSSSSSYLRSKQNVGTATPKDTSASSTSAANGYVGETDAATTLYQNAPTSTDQAEAITPAVSGDKQAEIPSRPEDRIQILDFHTPNPIVSYQNQFYSCEWTCAIGTDILITTPDPDDPHPVLRAGPGVSVLAATGLKLSGRPVQLDSRRPTNSKMNTGHQTPVPTSSDQPIATPEPTQIPTIEIPSRLAPNRARQNQADFLKRLIAVKAAKGEKDEVTVYTQRTNQGSGWRSQQRANIERQESEAREGVELEQGTPKSLNRGGAIGRPRRGAWRRSGPRTAKGGLFRDYKPRLWDTQGADIRNDPARTPESWDQLEGGGSSRQASATNMVASSSTIPPIQQQRSAASAASEHTPPVAPDPALSVVQSQQAAVSGLSGIATAPPLAAQRSQLNQEGSLLATGEGNVSNVDVPEDIEMEDA